MPPGDIEIIEFTGRVSESKSKEVRTYLLVIDGHHHKKYGKPNFEYLPKEWRSKYTTRSLSVGVADSWKEFYGLCTRRFEEEGPASGSVPDPRQAKETRNSQSVAAGPGASEDAPGDPASGGTDQRPPRVRSEESLSLDPEIQVIYHELLDEPLERPISLQYEISGYLTMLSTTSEPASARDARIARSIAERLQVLLDYVSSENMGREALRLVQAAVRYFTVAEDAIPDSTEGGFDDDAAVFNFVATRLDRTDLVISLANGPTDADE